MQIASPTVQPLPITPPVRWSRWWTSPIAKVQHAPGSKVLPWYEAFIPANRSITGQLRPDLTYGGTTLAEAIIAARLITAAAVDVTLDVRGRRRTVAMHPAIGILRDTKAGAFWLAPLRTTVRLGGEWIDAPHTIDGAAFEGSQPLLRGSSVLSATRDMVAVVGRDKVLAPGRWTDAPADSRLSVA